MNILDFLSTNTGEKPTIANRDVAEKCIDNPSFIDEIASYISDKNLKIASDCAEVMTMIAEKRPDLISKYSNELFNNLTHKKSNVRWEVAHALALTAHTIGDVLTDKLDDIYSIIENDDSIVVRDYAIDIYVGYAKIGKMESERVYPYLVRSLTIHNSRHAGHAMDGFINIIANTDSNDNNILQLIEPYKTADKKVTVTKVNKIIKLINKK